MSIPQIYETEKIECDKCVTLDECFKALSQLSNSKSPGPDGFPTEFYK